MTQRLTPHHMIGNPFVFVAERHAYRTLRHRIRRTDAERPPSILHRPMIIGATVTSKQANSLTIQCSDPAVSASTRVIKIHCEALTTSIAFSRP
jgi:hypothetical protein